MITKDYEPITDLEASRKKLNSIAATQIEVEDQVLFEGIQDVLASRAGDRWRLLDQLSLQTSISMMISLGYEVKTIGRSKIDACWMEVRTPDWTVKNYDVTKWSGPMGFYELYEVDLDNNTQSLVSNKGGLAAARLLSLLADAHTNTELEERDSKDYREDIA